jgi:hypothetical protein
VLSLSKGCRHDAPLALAAQPGLSLHAIKNRGARHDHCGGCRWRLIRFRGFARLLLLRAGGASGHASRAQVNARRVQVPYGGALDGARRRVFTRIPWVRRVTPSAIIQVLGALISPLGGYSRECVKVLGDAQHDALEFAFGHLVS